jgi:hypothetical protein
LPEKTAIWGWPAGHRAAGAALDAAERIGMVLSFLCQEPQRLARRYLRNNPLFALKIAGQLRGVKKYSPE